MVQTGGRGLSCTLPDGERVRALPEYRYLSWNPHEYSAFRRAIAPGMVALDVGANVGAYSMVLGQWVGPRGRVFAFEPSPAAFTGLVHHIRLNRLEGIVEPVPTALSDRDTVARFCTAGTLGEGRLSGPSDSLVGPTVSVTTIDTFCASSGIDPDFIKIDVEGWEIAALRGARETIRRRRGKLALFVEMHPSIWPLLGTSQDLLLDELRAQRLEPVALAGTGDPWATEGVALELRPL
jgi:FkbM family methyltransferase